MSRLTVVIPTYNRPGFLHDCLESISAQTLRDFNVVVLDNASTEEYGPVLEKFKELGIEYRRNPENIGAIRNIEEARRIGSKATYHMIFHDDDLMHPEMLQHQLEALDRIPNLQWVAVECAPFTSETTPEFGETSVGEQDLEVYDTPARLVRSFLEESMLHFGSVMYRSRDHAPPIRYDELEIVADRVFLTDLAAAGPVGLIRKPLVLYRHHEAQDSHNPIFREHHALSLMKYYRDILPFPLSAEDRSLLVGHATNYLLYVRSIIPPLNRMPLHSLIGHARREGLFQIRSICGQGIGAVVKMAGIESGYATARRILGPARRALFRR